MFTPFSVRYELQRGVQLWVMLKGAVHVQAQTVSFSPRALPSTNVTAGWADFRVDLKNVTMRRVLCLLCLSRSHFELQLKWLLCSRWPAVQRTGPQPTADPRSRCVTGHWAQFEDERRQNLWLTGNQRRKDEVTCSVCLYVCGLCNNADSRGRS